MELIRFLPPWSLGGIASDVAFADVLNTSMAAIQAAHDAELARLQAIVDRAGILPYDWLPDGKGLPLDLNGYVETFTDDFSTDTIMDPTGSPAGGKWYSPVHSTFGSAQFKRDAVTVSNGLCRIRMEQTAPPSATSDWGVWKTGHIQTMNKAGQGFSQAMGYFEARMKFPQQLVPFGWTPKTHIPLVPQYPADAKGARGAWPSFWLLSANEFIHDTNHLIEVDAIEAYGGDIGSHISVHLKPRLIPQPNDPKDRQTNSDYSGSQARMWDGNFHDYGVLYDDAGMTFYIDAVSIGRFPMSDYFRIPMYLNISLAMFTEKLKYATSPIDLMIEHVRVLKKD